jgi:hypothetical protein
LRLEQDFDFTPVERSQQISLKHAGGHPGRVSARGPAQ